MEEPIQGTMTEECFATCQRTACSKFFYCVQHWGEEGPNIGEGEL